jgi:hypothetical protein
MTFDEAMKLLIRTYTTGQRSEWHARKKPKDAEITEEAHREAWLTVCGFMHDRLTPNRQSPLAGWKESMNPERQTERLHALEQRKWPEI